MGENFMTGKWMLVQQERGIRRVLLDHWVKRRQVRMNWDRTCLFLIRGKDMVFLNQQDVWPSLSMLYHALCKAAFGEQPINDLVGRKG